MSSVAVIDYGMGNLHSIVKALQHADPETEVICTADSKAILGADRVVFPGVGAIRDCMRALNESGLDEVIRRVAAAKPLLGICLGMQALLTDSEENGGTSGLSLIPGHVVRFAENLADSDGHALKIPHMGWNQVHQIPHVLWQDIPQDSRFYFVHSYYARPDNADTTAATSAYPETFACALAQDNIFAVQFHPEKSQTAGLQLLRNFLRWSC
ncbi:imidazole glycerol phosphate synthase subunit HisH [Candidatus Methylomicrobium oryzae]|jgi:glutamine amidotransferase|uniref:imidazole glycerol phosphate synthase subunit HisH n=1 Tax=Candidatus Methylomicrobium oryzae TaxID=2802053 RepID=UPI00192175BE|nr:imidazole glycerol phosphate synthase subunit HisH [Methylomicrobium sp. RS1]MBL1265387.1 imidazole glycerol phosphate synthase subunit HisH [Methylomicrobium sp. RS1]